MSKLAGMDAVSALTETAFAARVERSKGTALVLFRSVWGGPSRTTLLALEGVARELHERLPVFEIDMMDNWAVANRHNVYAAPTLVLFDRGRELRRHEGIASRDEILALVSSVLLPSEESGLHTSRRIVVGLDDDAARAGVLKSLSTLLAIGKYDTVALVHSLPVFAWMRTPSPRQSWSRFVRGAHEKVEELLEKAKTELSRSGAHVETHALDGAPEKTLVSFAHELGASLIVVGALSPEERDLPMLGSVSGSLAAMAETNMLVVRPGLAGALSPSAARARSASRGARLGVGPHELIEADPLKVLVAIQNPADGLAAIEAFVEAIRTERVQVHLLCLLEVPDKVTPARDETLTRAQEILKRRAIPVTTEFGWGSPEREILSVASRRGTGLLVVSRGSIADRVVRQARSSVLVTCGAPKEGGGSRASF